MSDTWTNADVQPGAVGLGSTPGLSQTLTMGDLESFGEEKIAVGKSNRRRIGQWNNPIGGFVPKHRTRTVRELLSMLLRLDGDRLYQLQNRLWNAGLYGEKKPVWGYVTEETLSAYKMLITEAAIHPDQTINEVLNTLEESAIRGDERFGGGGTDQDIVELSNPDEITSDADELAQKILGKKLTKKQKEFLVEWTHSKERGSQGIVNAARKGGAAPDEVDAFMAAISGRESSGDPTARNARTGAYGEFQIMPQNWPKWAPMAGLPSNAPQTPDNQRKVAKAVMSSYYKQFGNWRDVAIAWYAGPGAAVDPRKRDRNRKQGAGNEPSINQYADQVMARFSHHRAVGVNDMGAGASAVEVTSPGGLGALGEQIRRMDPVGAAGMDFANTATEFEQLLGGGA
jgi:hypothetical protein